jgi:hypothetical protein
MSIPELLRGLPFVENTTELSIGVDIEGKRCIRVGCETIFTDFDMFEILEFERDDGSSNSST